MEGAGAAGLLQRTDKKIGQLTRVIHHLNAKGDDDLVDKASSYENEIEGILRDAGEQVRRFHAACQRQDDGEALQQAIQEVEARYEAKRAHSLRELAAFNRQAASAQQAASAAAGSTPASLSVRAAASSARRRFSLALQLSIWWV